MSEPPETLRRLQQVIDQSATSAGSAIRRNFIGGGWAMFGPGVRGLLVRRAYGIHLKSSE